MRAIVLLLTILTFFGCERVEERAKHTQEWMTSKGKLKVLSTTAMINDLVLHIAGDHVYTTTLIQGNLDPHSYQLVKGDDEKLKVADIVFYNGLGLEHGASLQHHLETNPKAVPLGNLIQKKFPEKIYYVQNQIDPHIWMDLSIFAESIPFIVESLSKLDLEHQNEYKANGDQLFKELGEVHERVKAKMHRIPKEKRYLVTSHDAFNYFTRAYLSELGEENWEIRFQAPEGLAPDSQLSSADIQHILDHLAKYKISVIFPETNVSQDSIRKIINAGKQKGLVVRIAEDSLYGDAMGSPGSSGDTYSKMLEHNAAVIEKYLNAEDP